MLLRVRFCEIVESSVESAIDSAELWNRWWIGVGEVKRILLLAKAKSSKNFLDSAKQNRGRILRFFCVRDSVDS